MTSALSTTISISTLLSTGLGIYITSRVAKYLYDYYTTDVHKIPSPPRPSWVWGHEMAGFIRSCGMQYRDWFDQYGTTYRYKAALGAGDIICTADAGIINHVLTKNLYDYEKSAIVRPIAERLVGHGLVWAEGDAHKLQRSLLNPAFSVENVRNMAPTVVECTERYITALENHLLSLPGATGVVDVQEWTAKLTLDIIGRIGFGHDFMLGQSPEAQRILEGWKNQATMGFDKSAMLGMALLRLFPALSSAPVAALKAQEETRETIKSIARGIVQEARNNLADDGDWGAKVKGATDIISLLLRSSVTDNGLTEDELLDNIVTFVVAGHETTSGTVNYTLLELAKQPELQTQLRRELSEFRKAHGGREPTYEEYMNGNKLPLLDAVTKEALRMYPAAPQTERVAVKDDVIPLRNPITTTDGKVMTELRIKKGQSIFFPVLAINRINSRWTNDADVFRPSRWFPENAHELPDKSQLASAGWNGSLVFSAGARLCIGYRLALYETKILMASMIRRFAFHDDGVKLEFKQVGSLQPRVIGRESEGVQVPIRMSFAEEEDEF
ncbi:hypothetical protein FRC04_002086 [Tulasnella sp. 424]|nr:hypothetical protein FRC04_002086 [Tulasnella sp. 424]KAG8967998.1 hypothetical protein FRC05_001708 [Tulasnella sp. 425]